MAATESVARERGRLYRWVGVLPLLVAAVYVVVAGLLLADLLHQVYRFSDTSMLPIVAAAWHDGRGPALMVTQDSVVAHIYDAALVPTGHFEGLAMAFGPLLTLVAVAFMGAAAWRATDRAGAAMTLAVAISIPPVIVWADLQQNNHLTTVFATALIAWHVTTLWRRTGMRVWIRSALVGISVGVCAVSDPQALASTMVPLVLTVAVLYRVDRRNARAVLPGVVITLAAAMAMVVLLPAAMSASGMTVVANFAPHLSIGGIFSGVSLGARGLVWMASGGWYGDPVGPASALGVILAVLIVALPFIVARREFSEQRRTSAATPARFVYAIYWCFSGLSLAGAFLASGDSFLPVQAHYIIGIFYAAAGLLATLGDEHAAPRLRLVTLAAAVCMIINAIVGVATVPATKYATGATDAGDAAVAAQLEAHGLHHGYAAYWDAYDIGWLSDRRLDIWPVISGGDCAPAAATTLCAYGLDTAVGAYRPSNAPTFLVVRATGPGCVHTAPAEQIFGTPTQTWTTGNLSVFVYPYDIASRFAPALAPLCTTD